MFDFIKRRRDERAKRQLLASGKAIIDAVDKAIDYWQEGLAIRADLLLSSFDERIVTLLAQDDISLTEVQEIEILAMMKSGWIAPRDERLAEAVAMIGELWLHIDALGVRAEIEAHIAMTYDQIGRELATRAIIATDQETARRGEESGRSIFNN